ncbi:MAG: hypothetical protein A2046_00110 [Bacteroidetes bacterium GWA2_30_7]|nr:MAG: hypothetical protein A2046_00110 [Bacteroidetes bacterium GWA2_30_7]
MNIILKFIKVKLNKISQFGLLESMQISEQKKVILTNQISILLFLFLFSLSLIFILLGLDSNFFRSLTILSVLTVPYLNKKGFYRFTSFFMSVIFPINVLIFSSYIKLNYNQSIDIIYYFVPRFLILGGLTIPLILIDWKHKLLLIIAVIINFSCLLSYDLVSNLFGVGVEEVKITFDKYYLVNVFIVLPYLFVLFGFIFLLNINSKYEKKILELLDELKIKNITLETQNEEILTQRDEIEAQRDLVTIQKEHIEEIHKEVTDSINYAKRIQQALLPDLEFLNLELMNLEENPENSKLFILFRPKDVVSGDFYWTAKVNNNLIVAVADCTGHGVPGAFMSMLGISFLNDIVRKKEITEADQILNDLRTEIINALKQHGEVNEQKDGMDISLLVISNEYSVFSNQKIDEFNLTHTTNNLPLLYKAQWSGANNPLWIVKRDKESVISYKEEKDLSLIELKPDKMPIAIYERLDNFTNHEIQLNSGDILYLMSDGYEDQFGGEKGKKFLSKNLKQLLIANCQLSMEEQKQVLEKTLNDWIGDGEQIDDITILGIKL